MISLSKTQNASAASSTGRPVTVNRASFDYTPKVGDVVTNGIYRALVDAIGDDTVTVRDLYFRWED